MFRHTSMVIGAALFLFGTPSAQGFGVLREPPELAELHEELLLSEDLDRIDDEEQQALPAPTRQHLRHQRPGASLVATTQAVERAVLDAEEIADEPVNSNRTQKLPLRTRVYPVSNKLVGRVLDGMPEELSNLAAAQAEQGSRQHLLEHSEQKSTGAIEDGARLRRQMAKLEADMFVENKLLKKFEAQRVHLDDEHDGISEKLKAMMGPRITLHQRRVQREKAALEKVHQEANRWEDMFKKSKAGALKLLKERKQHKNKLEAAHVARVAAEKQEEVARTEFEDVRGNTSQGIEAVKYANTRWEATKSDVVYAEVHEKDAEQSLVRIESILGYEQKRLNKAIEVSRKKVEKKLTSEKRLKEQSVEALVSSKKEYRRWEEQQTKEADKAHHIEAEFEDKQKLLDSARLHVLRAAGEQVGKNEDQKSHWDADDWAWSGSAEGVDDSMDVTTDLGEKADSSDW
mmetsp:Transcript_37752/g.95640  ORF Transcript_37752/g.95640 Transcript_37752/m.95640 type:complete len:459 (-) Transcript_37752:166-1542(-)